MQRSSDPAREILVQRNRVELDPALPPNRTGVWIDDHLEEALDIAPRAEVDDIEQISQVDVAFEAVVEYEPERIIRLCAAFLNGWSESHPASAWHALEAQSQDSAPPVWYSVTRVSKKFFSFFRSIISLIQGKGLLLPGNKVSIPICWLRRLAM